MTVPSSTSTRTVVIVAPPGATLQDLTGPWEVFCRAAVYVPGSYRVLAASADASLQVITKFGLEVTCHRAIAELDGAFDTVLVAGSDQVFSGPRDQALLAWLQDVSTRCRRIGSICTGAFYLAQAGLLRGRRATTHWRYLQQLAQDFPDVQVESEPIFVRDGSVWTSAGITAGIDPALGLVEEDCGREVAQTIARDLVVFLQRHPDQPQLSATLSQRLADREPIRQLQSRLADRLQSVSSVSDMAELANMSPRNFSRLFKQETGVTPGSYLRTLRAEAAKRRVHEASGKKVLIAAQLGFGSTRSMQRAVAPSAGRKKIARSKRARLR